MWWKWRYILRQTGNDGKGCNGGKNRVWRPRRFWTGVLNLQISDPNRDSLPADCLDCMP